MEAYLQGDTSALGIIFKRYSDSAYATAMRVLSNPSEAEDAVHLYSPSANVEFNDQDEAQGADRSRSVTCRFDPVVRAGFCRDW